LGGQADLWCAPWLGVPDEGVEDDHELAHGGGERELLGFAGGDQASVEGAQCRVVPDRAQGRHVEHRAHVVAAAPDRATPLHQAAVARERRHPDQRGDGTAIELAELRQQGEQEGGKGVRAGRWKRCQEPFSTVKARSCAMGQAIATRPFRSTRLSNLREAPAGRFSPRSHWLIRPAVTFR
jgi:hypothetical protein